MANEDPIAFLFTWSTYGTWLPGDARGWVEYKHGFQLPDPVRELEARARMTSEVVYLNAEQREQLHQQVAETCAHKGWTLLAVNCRSNHIRALISASTTPKKMRAALKAWCSQRLNDLQKARGITGEDATTVWWADRGSIRWLFDDNSVDCATVYVRDEQDNSQRFRNAEPRKGSPSR